MAVVCSQQVGDALYVESTVTQSATSHRLPAAARFAACLPATGTPYCTEALFDLFIRIPFLLGGG
jgi:hypothetical protein